MPEIRTDGITRWKEDYRPKLGAWAPGSYLSKCWECFETFIGDKRARSCADCAYATKEKHESLP